MNSTLVLDTSSPKKRRHEFDIAKGLLMLFVIMGHVKVFSDANIYNINLLWNGFFMQAFFFISGYCSSYKKDWNTFISDNVKGILVPLVCISFLITFLRLIGGSLTDWRYELVHINLNYWFLLAIFIARFIYRAFSDKNILYKSILSILLYLIGFILWKYEILPNVWYFKHALLLLPFLVLGDICKGMNIDSKNGIACIILYFLLLVLNWWCGFENTVVASDIHLNWNNLLQGLAIPFFGSIAIIYLCKLMKRCIFLEYLGKNSLILFMVHILFLNVSVRIFNRFVPTHEVLAALAMFAFTVLFSTILIYIVNLKYFKWMTGKF